jgi:hypothetical protein
MPCGRMLPISGVLNGVGERYTNAVAFLFSSRTAVNLSERPPNDDRPETGRLLSVNLPRLM